MKETILDLDLPGEPVPKARARGGNGRHYTPARTRRAEEAIRWQLLARKVRPIREGELEVELTFRLGNRRRADADNLTKLTLDACNGIAWRDDAQVARLVVHVERAHPQPGTHLTIRRLCRHPRR